MLIGQGGELQQKVEERSISEEWKRLPERKADKIYRLRSDVDSSKETQRGIQ